MARECVDLETVVIGYERPLLKGISLRFEAQNAYVLSGDNAIGKSTFLKTLGNIIPPLSGRISPRVQPNNWHSGGVTAGVMIQEEFGAFEETNVIEILKRILPRRRRGTKNAIDSVRRLSKLVDLEFAFCLKPFQTLSGGQRKQAAIVIAVAGEPDCIILDEVFGGLDSKKRGLLAKNLKDYVLTHNAIVVAADHDVAPAKNAGFIEIRLSQWKF